MKKVIILCLLSVLAGAGCATPQTGNFVKNDIDRSTGVNESRIESSGLEKQISIKDVSEFLLVYQETVDLVASKGNQFLKDSIDPKLQQLYMVDGSDVPLMRYLGRKGLNDIESNNLEERVATLQAHPCLREFV